MRNEYASLRVGQVLYDRSKDEFIICDDCCDPKYHHNKNIGHIDYDIEDKHGYNHIYFGPDIPKKYTVINGRAMVKADASTRLKFNRDQLISAYSSLEETFYEAKQLPSLVYVYLKYRFKVWFNL